MLLGVEEIVSATEGVLLKKGNIGYITRVDTDSRKADSDSLFVPLKGERFDGHSFIEDVLNRGCRVIISEIEIEKDNVTCILVKDTRTALGKLAKYYIKKINPKRIAITGSVGKTTTKDMIASVCECIAPTLKTLGNFNNDIGLPLTAFRLQNEKIGIFEMGMSHFNEIDYLSHIVCPEIAVITNIGYSHVENLGSREGILKAKLEVLNHMDTDSTVILNGDDKLLWDAGNKTDKNVIYFGIENNKCNLVARDIKESDGKTLFTVDGEEYEINTPGTHNIYNALCALAVGRMLTEDITLIKQGLKNYRPEGIRQNIVKKNGITVIADCYNAAPDSMLASLEVMSKLEGKRRIAVFGSVAELGEKRDELLFKVGEAVPEYNTDMLITVTEDALAINKGAESKGFSNQKNLPDNGEVLKYLKTVLNENDIVLIKGSRKYKMEEISEGLLNE